MAPAEFDSQFVYSEAGLGGDSEIQWETAATGLQSLRLAVAPKRCLAGHAQAEIA